VTRLHTHHFGDADGPPLLAIHGITAHGRRFRRLAEEAWPERHTIAVDLRGHGRSTSDGPWSIVQHVRDLIDTLDELGLDSVDVVGHSYGGCIALTLLATAPHRVRRLALLDPALALPGSFASGRALGTIEFDGWATVEEATAARNEDVGDDDSINPAVIEDVEEHLVLGEDGRYRFRFHEPAVITGWGEVCYPLPDAVARRPTLLIVADRAELVQPSTIAELHELLDPGLEVVHLSCGHMHYWEQFDETAAAVTDFFRTTERTQDRP
jgi:lipase